MQISQGDALKRLVNFLTGSQNTWKYTFKELPRFDDQGRKIYYTVQEVPVTGYESQWTTAGDPDKGFTATITNTLLTRVPVKKVWGGVPEEDWKGVEAGLYWHVGEGEPEPVMRQAEPEEAGDINTGELGDGDESAPRHAALFLNADNDWSGIFENLPRFTSEGERIIYTVQELTVGGISVEELPEGERYIIHYTPEEQANDEQPGYKISNIKPTKLTGTKIWRDDSNADGGRPNDLTLHLRRSTDSNAYDSLTPGDYDNASPSNASWELVTQEMLEEDGSKLIWDKSQGGTWS